MAKEDIRTYSIEELRAMRARGEAKKTPRNAPTYEPDEGFWKKVEQVLEMRQRQKRRKVSVHLRLDPKTFEAFRSRGPGHLTRMANVLQAVAEVSQITGLDAPTR